MPNTALDELRLCSFCAGVVKWQTPLHDTPPVRLPHHPTFGSLVASGETCRLCELIASLWEFDEGHLTRFSSDTNPAARATRESFAVCVDVKDSGHMGSGLHWTLLEVNFLNKVTGFSVVTEFTLTARGAQEFGASQSAWTTAETGISDKMATIKSWLQECQSQAEGGHAGCQPAPFAPLRLVSVGLDGNPPRLVQRHGDEGPTEYATLSHCWGSAPPLQTMKATLDSFSSAIPMDVLPKTFADAMQMARDLAIPYIWIDALCIVQDDLQEWQSEAARMDRVYSGSQLTISAAQSSNGSEGCFRSDGNGYGEDEMLFRAKFAGDDQADLLVRVYRGDVRTSGTASNALSARGWTLQEQLLSKRVVYCMQPEMHWCCSHHYGTESGLRFFKDQVGRSGLPLQMPYAPGRFLRPQLGKESEYWKWTRIVENYSSRSFTFPRDRVAAIAGIIRVMTVHIGEESVLGLWKTNIAKDLGWLRITRHIDPAFRSLAESLPSWTWLASQGRLSYDFWGFETLRNRSRSQVRHHVSLLEWNVQWDGTPYASAVISASLRLEGCVRDIRIRPFAAGAASNPPYFQVFDEDIQRTNDSIWWRCSGQFDAGGVTETATYPCLLLRSRTFGENSGTSRIFEEFLILAPASSSDDSKYRRIGLARIDGELPVFDPSKKTEIVLV